MGDVIEILTTATNTVEVEAQGPQGIPGVGVPTGGSALQILRKKTSTDYDTEWAAAGSGSGSVTSVALASTDLTISGSPITDSGTITANIAANAVTLEKLQTISSEHLLGRHGSGNGGVQQVGLGTGLAISGSNVRVATTGITAGTYTKLTVDETGRATVGATATPSDIGAQSAQDTETLSLSASVTLTGSRNKLWKISNSTAFNYFVELPTTGIAVGDIVEIEYTSSTGRELAIRRDGVAFGMSLPNGARGTYRADTATATGWTAVGTNYNSASSIYVSQGDVLLGRQDSAGQVQFISCTAAGRELLDDADAAAQRTTLGLGTAATAATGDFAAASHSHELTALAATGATNGHVLTANGSNGVTFAALPASGVTGAASSASDVLGVSGSNITGVDANADRIIFWDDSASALKHLTVGSGLSLTDTTLTATATGTIGGSTSTDNAIVRADSTSNTVQDSALVIDDATTSTQANVALRNNHSETNSALVLCNKGTGAFIVSPARPDATSSGGNVRGASSVCIVPARTNANQVASGANSVAIGTSARAGGSSCVVLGNGATDGTGNNAVAIGASAASTTESISVGYNAISASGAVSVGQSNASGTNSVSLGSSSNSSLRAQFNCRPFAAVYWGGQTVDGTANVELNLDATATNRMTIAANTAVIADIYVIARRTDNTKFLSGRRWVAIRRDGSNNTALIGAVQTIGTDQSEGSPTWTFTIDADDTASVESLRVRVTGAAAETVNWRVCAIYRVVA